MFKGHDQDLIRVGLTRGSYIDVIYTICGWQFGPSKEPEVGRFWSEVGGKPLSILLLFLYMIMELNNNV